MGRMVIIGGQTVVSGPAAGAEALNDAVFHQQIQNAVDGHPIDRTAALQGFKYVID